MSEESEKKGWLARLRAGLSRSSSRLSDGIGGIFSGRKLDDAALEELEDLLITSDLGVETAAKLSASLAGTRFDKEVSADEIRTALADEMSAIMEPVARPLAANAGHRPHVILVTGVNGSGKTTTIGKLAKRLREDGKSVMLAAGDTFRAAAIEQLKIWGERTGCTVVASEQGADAASLADCRHYVSAVTEGKYREFDSQLFANLRVHSRTLLAFRSASPRQVDSREPC